VDPRDAVVSIMTAGRAVLFAGGTVVISLFGLFLIGQAYMIGLAGLHRRSVLMVLHRRADPAARHCSDFAGNAIDKLHLPGLLQSGGPPRLRRVLVPLEPLRSAAGLGHRHVAAARADRLAVPLFSMRLAFTDAGNDPPSLTTRQAYDLLAQGFGPGFNGPLVVAVAMPGPGRPRRPSSTCTGDRRDARCGLRRAAGSSTRKRPVRSSSSTRRRRRRRPRPKRWCGPAQRRDPAGGPRDRGRRAGGRADGGQHRRRDLPRWAPPFVIAAVLILVVPPSDGVFRSVVLPLKAVIMNLLSVGAAYGVMVAVFQWGWLGGLIGIGETGPIDPWIPVTMFTILFGLSMDYEVFLLSRIREEWLRTGDNSLAVADGLAVTGRIITAAAAIMFCVFASFVIKDPLHILKVFGLGLAVAVAVDVTLVRMVWCPSMMELLGSP
jgi:RND superfamily putative drug exporter